MYKVFFSLIIFIIFLATILICIVQPKMHKQVFIFDSEYELVETQQQVETKKVMPTQKLPAKSNALQKKVVSQNVSTTQKKVQTKQQNSIAKTYSQKKTQKSPSNKVTKTNNNAVKKTSSTSNVVKKSVQPTLKKVTTTQTMTEAERIRQETILWNKWRSDLQNKIMSDTKLPIVPQGTIFKFTFNVDKYGKISNVQTWSTNPTYTPYAIQYIAPVIRSYQGRSILDFPAGSNRVATTVEGGWKISTKSKYSTSADYNDSERINR